MHASRILSARWLVVGALSVLLLTCQPISVAPAATPQSSTAARRQGDAVPSIALRALPYRFDQPLFLTHAGDGSGRMFVVEKTGRIRIVKDGQVLATPFLDLSRRVKSDGSEQGLLGLAFHPRYRENGRFFVAYTARNGDDT